MEKKILFCTVDSWNTKIPTSSSNTYINLFDNYPDKFKAALFIREEMPNSPCCSRYFQISEQRIIKSLFSREIMPGQEILPGTLPTASDFDAIKKKEKLYNKNKNRSFFRLIAREIIWLLGRWKTSNLDNFLIDYNPEIVIFSLEGYIHFNRICRYVVKTTNAKAIAYIWDDNFTYKQVSRNIGFYLFRFLQRMSLKRTAKFCSAFWAISPKTKAEADLFFGVNSIIITKPVDFLFTNYFQIDHPFPLRILYTGNLAIGRFNSLVMLSKLIQNINSNEKKFFVDVYSNTHLTSEQLSNLCEDVTIHKAISSEDAIHLQTQSDILLLLEDINGKFKNKARLSFSTKITDYLSAGKCIVAVGPSDIAPIEYLKSEDAALCASTEKELLEALLSIVKDKSLLYKYEKNAISCGERNHQRSVIQNRIKECFDNL